MYVHTFSADKTSTAEKYFQLPVRDRQCSSLPFTFMSRIISNFRVFLSMFDMLELLKHSPAAVMVINN